MPFRVYISLQNEDRIAVYDLAPDTGALTLVRSLRAEGGPAPLTIHPNGQFAYAGLRQTRQIVSYRVEHSTGGWLRLGTTPLRSDPCYLSVDQTGRYLLSAYYAAGMVSVHGIDGQGLVREEAIQWLETAPHAHCIRPDWRNRYVYVPHTMPANSIWQFRLDTDSGRLLPLDPPRAPVPEGVGPRHYCYLPRLDRLYVSNEDSSTVSVYHINPDNGQLTHEQLLSTLPEGFTGKNTTAQIHLHPTGRWLYVSNRGHDSIATFAVDQTTGRLTALGQAPSEPTPRTFNLDPSGRYLFAAGIGSGKLATYRVEPTGLLSRIATYEVGENPMWVLVLEV